MSEEFQPLTATEIGGEPGEAEPGGPPVASAPVQDGPGGWGLAVAVILIWCVEVVVTFAVTLAEGGSLQTMEHDLAPLNVLTITMISTFFSFLIVWYFVCHRYGKSIRDGFALKGVERKTLKKWAFLSILIGLGAAAIAAFAGEEEGYFLADFVKQPDGLTVIMLFAVLLPPFEEFYYRGMILPALSRKAGVAAVPLTALWFTTAHAFQLWGNWPVLATVAAMGLIWSVQRYCYKSLLPSLVSHWCYNATMVIITMGQVLIETIGKR